MTQERHGTIPLPFVLSPKVNPLSCYDIFSIRVLSRLTSFSRLVLINNLIHSYCRKLSYIAYNSYGKLLQH